jgi:uncharacterized protein (TIGR00251 family)
MKIDVVVHPGSSQKKVLVKDSIYHVYIHCRPDKGKANAECIDILSKHFQTRKTGIKIIAGDTSRKKVIEIQS